MKTVGFLLGALALGLMFPLSAASQGSLLVVGGGGEEYNDWSDVPYRWLVTHAPNRKIIVLHYADTSKFFSGYLPWLSSCTVTNLSISSVAQANDSAVYRRILEHDGIFLRGGDQWQYIDRWRHTLAERAIREVYRRGGVVGGTSAGAMILSDAVFDAQYASVQPRTALRNPLGASVTLTDDFLDLLPNTIIDSHFYERGRVGRLAAFLAIFHQSSGREITGVGVDANTALAIGPDRVGEAMGSGTVTLMRFSPATQYVLEAGKPLSLSNVRFDQLTATARFSFATGELFPPASGRPYAAAEFSSPEGAVILDGSGSTSEWGRAEGSLKKLEGALASGTDTVGIIAPLAAQATASAVGSVLASRGVAYRLLLVSEAAQHDTAFASAISSCGGFVLLGNSPDSLARFLDSSTVAGAEFSWQVRLGTPLAFLGDDTGLAGEKGIGQMYRSIYGAYYGYLTQVDGLGVLKGIQNVSRLYEQSDYIDNRASSVFWSMATESLPFGLMLDAGTHVTVAGGQLRVHGSTPAVLTDARLAVWASTPDWRDPGKLNPRQNGGILGATVHFLRDGETYDLMNVGSVDRPEMQSGSIAGFSLLQNYPNPFNGRTEVGSQMSEAGYVKLAVYDLLGREVAVLVDEWRAAGTYRDTFSADKVEGKVLASGVYIYRVLAGPHVQSRTMLLLK